MISIHVSDSFGLTISLQHGIKVCFTTEKSVTKLGSNSHQVCVKVEISGKVIQKLCNALASDILHNCAKSCKIIISTGYEKQMKVHKNKSAILESHVHPPTTQI